MGREGERHTYLSYLVVKPPYVNSKTVITQCENLETYYLDRWIALDSLYTRSLISFLSLYKWNFSNTRHHLVVNHVSAWDSAGLLGMCSERLLTDLQCIRQEQSHSTLNAHEQQVSSYPLVLSRNCFYRRCKLARFKKTSITSERRLGSFNGMLCFSSICTRPQALERHYCICYNWKFMSSYLLRL